ncbi:MAG: hypothetical protein WDM76_18000 [Limisphaerales bacterium]
MKNQILLPVIAAIPLVVAGCASDAHYVETGGRQNIVSVDQIIFRIIFRPPKLPPRT